MSEHKKIWMLLFTLGLALLLISIILVKCTAEEADPSEDMIKGFATAYNGPTDTTCTGKKVHEGICGGCKSYIGKTIILYHRLPGDKVGEIIGVYECEDTGPGTKGFQEGRVIDVWQEDKKACQEFMNLIYKDNCQGKVWIQVIDNTEG